MTATDLIRYFETEIRRIDDQRIRNGVGNEPQYPMALVFLGNATACYTTLVRRLEQLWPQYSGELLFLHVQKGQGSACRVCQILPDGQDGPMEPGGGIDQIEDLFGADKHFPNRNQLMLYYVIDTSNMISAEEFRDLLALKTCFQRELGIGNLMVNETLFLLLENAFGKKAKVSDQILTALAADIPDLKNTSTVLIGHVKQDRTFNEWSECYDALASVVAVTNSDFDRILVSMYQQGCYTVAYHREEKPTRDIGWVMVTRLLEYISNNLIGQHWRNLSDKEIASDFSYRSLVAKYVNQVLMSKIPTNEELLLFPRKDITSYYDEEIPCLSQKDFDDYTMGAWLAYLKGLTRNVEKEIARGGNLAAVWSDAYTQQLNEKVPIRTLAALMEHPETLYAIIEAVDKPANTNQGLAAAAGDWMLYSLLTSPTIRQLFRNILQKQQRRAEQFSETWRGIQDSVNQVHVPSDSRLISFYSLKFQHYLDGYGEQILNGFESLTDPDSLDAFLEKELDRIISKITELTDPFEEELQQRLQHEHGVAISNDVKMYIARKLASDNTSEFLTHLYDLGSPVVSAVLLKRGTELHQRISEALSDVYFYNTNDSSKAEAVYMYIVGKDNLDRGATIS